MYAFLGLTVLTAAVSLGVYSVADAQVNQKEEITKEEFLDFQRQWFNYMDQRGMNPGDVLHLLDERCSPATMGVAGPRFFGFVIGGSLPVTLAANWLAGAWDQNSALYQIAPGTAHVEQIALRWLVDLFGLPPDSGGAFVTGATSSRRRRSRCTPSSNADRIFRETERCSSTRWR